jgi:hypothetical protein
MEAAHSSWVHPPAEEGWLDRIGIEGLSDVAAERVEQEFGNADIAVWKDPRTCLTFPFWRPVLGSDNTFMVLIHPHPHEVARSLHARNKFGTGASFALWERYYSDALRYSAELPTVVISDSDILADPVLVMTGLATSLRGWGAELPNDPATTNMEFESSEHHVSDTDDLDPATDSQRALYHTLVTLDGPHESFEPPTLPEPHPLSLELLAALSKANRYRKRAEAAKTTTNAKRPRPTRAAMQSARQFSQPDDTGILNTVRPKRKRDTEATSAARAAKRAARLARRSRRAHEDR